MLLRTINSGIILGFDFGMKYIGVATGQVITKTATPCTCLLAKDGIPNWQEIIALVTKWQPELLIVGIPLNMDGTEQQLTFCARKFANRLHEHTKLKIYPVDERLSTWEAKRRLLVTVKSNKLDYQQLNATAAAVIVEQWLQANTDNTLA